MDLAAYIDHTLLHPGATEKDIENLCKEALRYHFYAVCVNGSHVSYAAGILKDSEVKIAAVVGFPLGAASQESKIFELQQAIKDGADEIDMVINIGWIKEGGWALVENEISAMKRAAGDRTLKVIFENCYLTPEEIRQASLVSIKAGADFIKTSTGFGSGGATEDDVALMKETAGDKILIKASGGIRDRNAALRYIELGANRLGTSSGVRILTQQ